MKKHTNILQNGAAAIFGGIFIASLLPVLWVAPYVRSTGDDLNYSVGVHMALMRGEGLGGVLCAVADSVKGTWHSWQGTWSSIALFSLQPGVWGNKWYPLTVAVALLCILAGTWYFLHTVLRLLGMKRSGRWTLAFLLGTLLIQYLPNDKCGLFWWTSVAHYIVPYGITMMCMGWSLRWLESGRFRFLIGDLLGMAYLGGAGYPEVVLAAVWFFLLIVGGLIQKRNVKRILWLMLPFLLEMAGFAFSAMAPGNKNRGGEEFGFSFAKVFRTLAGCVQEGVTESIGDFLRVRPLILLVILIVLFAWRCTDTERALWRVRHPLLLAAAGLGISCLVRAPVIYAEADPSGGVPDSYWLISMTAMTVCLAGITVYFKRIYAEQHPDILRKSGYPIEGYACVLVLFLCALFYRHIIGGTVDYTCIRYVQSGALADYREQMEEWLSILEDPSVSRAELPAMNDDQGPFMLMVPLEDEDAWSSRVYARYYSKESVVCVPRD